MLIESAPVVIASFIVNAIVNYYFIIFLIPIALVFFGILVYFVATSR